MTPFTPPTSSICKVCGKPFANPHGKRVTCSAACSRQHKRNKAAAVVASQMRKCSICGAEFRDPNHRRRTCGAQACINRLNGRNPIPLAERVLGTCVICGKPVKAVTADGNRRKGKLETCSRKCGTRLGHQRALRGGKWSPPPQTAKTARFLATMELRHGSWATDVDWSGLKLVDCHAQGVCASLDPDPTLGWTPPPANAEAGMEAAA